MPEEQITKDQEIVKRGLNANPKIYVPSDTLIETLHTLEKLPIAQTEYEVHKMKLEDALYDAHTFLNHYYKLRKVGHPVTKRIFGKDRLKIKMISPLKLPIILRPNDDIFSGSVSEVISKEGCYIIFREINLSEIVSEHTSASYIHEVTHTQIDGIQKSIREYYNLEVFSIFNELFHASILGNDERLLRLNDCRRIYEMSISAQELKDHHTGISPMSRDELLDCSKYLISGLKAYNLFITFYNSSNEIRNEILKDIQSIFDGYLTVEEVLLKYEATLDASQDQKRLTKYFSRG